MERNESDDDDEAHGARGKFTVYSQSHRKKEETDASKYISFSKNVPITLKETAHLESEDDETDDCDDVSDEDDNHSIRFEEDSLKRMVFHVHQAKKIAMKHGNDIFAIILTIFVARQVWMNLSSPVSPSPGRSSLHSSSIAATKGDRGSRITLFKVAVVLGLAVGLTQSRITPLAAIFISKAAGLPSFLTFLLYLFAMPGDNTVYIPKPTQHYSFETLNHRHELDAKALSKVMSENNPSFWNITASNPLGFLTQHASSRQRQDKDNSFAGNTSTVVVLEMTGLDASLSQLDLLRDQISFLLSQHRQKVMKRKRSPTVNATLEGEAPLETNVTTDLSPLEVVISLESSGGSASEYSLLAQQLLRIRNEPDITLTIIVDKVAASGGYMLACTSTPGHLFAAPLAVLGSIGVVGQTLNFYETLHNYGVESLTFRSGRAKAPLTPTGEITKEGMSLVQEMMDDVHSAFQSHVADCRPLLADRISELATGEIWLGRDALKHGLIDACITR
jgi:serine protease SohB